MPAAGNPRAVGGAGVVAAGGDRGDDLLPDAGSQVQEHHAVRGPDRHRDHQPGGDGDDGDDGTPIAATIPIIVTTQSNSIKENPP